MKKIWFKQKFYNIILEGKKTQTIRLWKRNHNFLAGDKFQCFFGFKHKKINAKIKSVEFKTFDKINDDEVWQDGFKSKKELLININSFYPDFDEKKSVLCFIKFVCL